MFCNRFLCYSVSATNWIIPRICSTNVSFSTTFHRTAKVFVDKENSYAHDVLKNSLNNYNLSKLEFCHKNDEGKSVDELASIVLHPPVAENTTTDEVFNGFYALTRYCNQSQTCISQERFTPFCQLFCKVSEELTDEQLLQSLLLLAMLPPTDSVKVPNFVEIWNTLDVVCCRRIENWNTDKLLLFCDTWYSLNLGRICEFVWEALRKIGRKVKRMTPVQLVHSMFFCNVLRKPVFDMFDFEVRLNDCIDSISLQELGVMAMGFFKTQTPIRNQELITKLYQRLMLELHSIEDITLVSLLKVLRYSSKIPQADLMTQLLHELCPQIKRLSLLSCLHIALLGSDIQLCHEPSMELILERFNSELEKTRLKDLERICFVVGSFNYESPKGIDKVLCARILENLKNKVHEIVKYPRCFPACLHYLTLKGYYDAEMISSALDVRFTQHAYGKNMVLGREIFHLDSFIKINLMNENYNGHQLSEKHRRTMGKLLTQYIPERNPKYRLNLTDRILLEIKETIDRIFKFNKFKHILPHFARPDILLCYDRNTKNTISLSEECPEDYSGAILTRKCILGAEELDNIDTVAVVVAGRNNVVREKNCHTGLFNLKLNQLNMLGHKYVVIYWHEWRELETLKDREMFVKRKLSSVVKM